MAKVGKVDFKMPCSEFTLWSRLFVFCVVSFFSLATSAAPRIIGGEVVESGDADSRYPWMVSLRDVNSGAHVCGGTLIDKKWVLTASSCHYQQSAHSLVAVLGDYDLSLLEETEQRVDVIQRLESGRDLMLLELATEVDTELFTPLRIADSSIMETVSVGDVLEIIGWGDREVGNAVDFPNILHYANVPLIANNACADEHSTGLEKYLGSDYLSIYGIAIDEKHLCTLVDLTVEDAGRAACQGDYGGPLLYESFGQLVQIGVLSFGSGLCDFSKPDVYTNVSEYFQWIQETISQRDISVSSLVLNDMVVSIVDKVDVETGLVSYELESVDVHELNVTNNSTSSVLIESVELELVNSFVLDDPNTEEVEGQKQELFDKRFQDRAVLSASETEVLQCTGAQLEAGAECQVRIESLFINAGPKIVLLKLNLAGVDEPVVFELAGNVLSQANFSSTFADSSYLFQHRSNEWQTAYAIKQAQDAVDLATDAKKGDYFVEEISGAETLISSLSDYDETRLIVKLKGSGSFYFDWLVEQIGTLDLSVYLNGALVKTLDVQGLYVRELILLEEEGVNTIEFRLKQGEEWPSLLTDELSARQYEARLKTMSFDSNAEEIPEPEVVADDDSGSGSGSLFIIAVLFAFLYGRKKCYAGGVI